MDLILPLLSPNMIPPKEELIYEKMTLIYENPEHQFQWLINNYWWLMLTQYSV